MWYKIGRFVVRYRLSLLISLAIVTSFMGYMASKVTLSYDFNSAIPKDNVKFQEFMNFKQRFGDDGHTMVLGIQTNELYSVKLFNQFATLQKELKNTGGVVSTISIPETVILQKNDSLQRLEAVKIFHYPYTNQAQLDSDKMVFENQPFYRGLLYNPSKNCYLMALQLDKDSVDSKSRTDLIDHVLIPIRNFEKTSGYNLVISGMPYIRTITGTRIKNEMKWFLTGSFLLSAITLFLFFRSISATVMSLLVVGMGVVWSVATIVLLGYKITLLTALIPPLVVVIGIPNCIYFLNKYHTSYRITGNKEEALVTMVGRMGIVTLFCNIAAAIGFAVFALTRSALLKEFGAVSGINIMALFFISLIFIPAVLSYLPPPQPKHVRYLDNKFLEKVLVHIERWTFHHKKWVYGVSLVVSIIAVTGVLKLKREGFIVDDLPKTDQMYTDLKWFETNFNGIMPLEILIDTKKKNGLFKKPISHIEKINELSNYIDSSHETARPLSYVEALKFARQAIYDGDSANYTIPTEYELPIFASFIKSAKSGKTASNNGLNKMIGGYMDSTKQMARISVNMKDIGSIRLPILLNDFQKKAVTIFDTSAYKITFTGSCVTFLEGSRFIIDGLIDSILWAFLFIALCMLYLFRSFRILLCSLIPNIIPLLITAGVMGWVGVSLRPSTVLVFSIALGISIDVTIRFLINYKQELPHHQHNIKETLVQTIRHTGISIIYTSLVLIAGFVIFCFSNFGGTKGLGWLTSITLISGTITNLVLLPVLLDTFRKKSK